MADPITIMTAVSLGSSALGGVMGAKGAKQSAAATSQMYTYQAGIADLNRRIALNNRDYSIYAGGEEAKRFGMKAAQTGGSIRAKQGASGVDVGSGSSKDVQAGHQTVTDLDTATIRNNAARKAYGYQFEAETAGKQAEIYNFASANALEAGDIKATESLISGASNVSSKWLQGNKAGLWGS